MFFKWTSKLIYGNTKGITKSIDRLIDRVNSGDCQCKLIYMYGNRLLEILYKMKMHRYKILHNFMSIFEMTLRIIFLDRAEKILYPFILFYRKSTVYVEENRVPRSSLEMVNVMVISLPLQILLI